MKPCFVPLWQQINIFLFALIFFKFYLFFLCQCGLFTFLFFHLRETKYLNVYDIKKMKTLINFLKRNYFQAAELKPTNEIILLRTDVFE